MIQAIMTWTKVSPWQPLGAETEAPAETGSLCHQLYAPGGNKRVEHRNQQDGEGQEL